MSSSKIYVSSLEEMTRVCARLAREDVLYTARPDGTGWVIHIHGY